MKPIAQKFQKSRCMAISSRSGTTTGPCHANEISSSSLDSKSDSSSSSNRSSLILESLLSVHPYSLASMWLSMVGNPEKKKSACNSSTMPCYTDRTKKGTTGEQRKLDRKDFVERDKRKYTNRIEERDKGLKVETDVCSIVWIKNKKGRKGLEHI